MHEYVMCITSLLVLDYTAVYEASGFLELAADFLHMLSLCVLERCV